MQRLRAGNQASPRNVRYWEVHQHDFGRLTAYPETIRSLVQRGASRVVGRWPGRGAGLPAGRGGGEESWRAEGESEVVTANLWAVPELIAVRRGRSAH